MYIFHLISIDLQSSRLDNSHTLQSLHKVMKSMYFVIDKSRNAQEYIQMLGLKFISYKANPCTILFCFL